MGEVVGNEKFSHMGENAHNEFHGAGLASPFIKGATMTVSLFSIILFIGAFISTRWSNVSVFTGDSFRKVWSHSSSIKPCNKKIEYSLNCSEGNLAQTCPVTPLATFEPSEPSTETCPEYFRWIYEDLRPWRETGITRDMVERAKPAAYIRVVVVDGKVYMEKYKGVYQTRDVFTIWGILQLLRMYPGKLPDFDLMFSCGDKLAMKTRYFQGPNATTPPPLFHYCGDDETYDIVFPDWSFWGWPEIHIKQWNTLKKDLKEGNNRTKWIDREPYAYWKGNINLGLARHELSKCNKTSEQDWNARIYDIDWRQEIHSGFNSSDLASQCTHRYKIYTEGVTWSVSEKYILACDSVTLLANPHYYDFFTRSLQPMVHYWPLKLKDMCKSIKFATEWCNNHTEKAQEIAKAGSSFVQEKLKMKFVYDYMFHLLSMYAKLLKFKPSVPPGAVEFCPETMVCPVKGLEKDYKIQSMVRSPSDTGPCTMPPPYDPAELKDVLEKKDHVMKQVETWEESGTVGGDL
ncbi:O-glucosyltransferase rumi [Vitis vinifera]|uniref:O-glucosyltransferase rumi n=1 Tax=Vitis vinifera TaxID=29760 RepID=A0A438H9U9_VITVI|nr:O-glucosyltransferase rumi [Vitis vinifera]